MLIVIVVLITTNAITLKLYLESIAPPDESILAELCGEEIDSVKLFINDWYDEISLSQKNADVYYNELRFENGKYTLTVALNRIRAVYPRGERFFKLQYIRYIEFYKNNGGLLCRLYYGENGEFVFRID